MKELYQKLKDGDRLTTPELVSLKDHCENAAKLLSELGPEYTLASQELHRRAYQASDYLFNRANKT